MRELVNQHNHGIQPVITPVVQINANEWVTLELLMAVTGLRKGTILRARDSAWMNGREYKQIAPDGTPK
ncbi:TPA: excisionase family protein, partial [Escherichia coli]